MPATLARPDPTASASALVPFADGLPPGAAARRPLSPQESVRAFELVPEAVRARAMNP
jgi:hypothetical protein